MVGYVMIMKYISKVSVDNGLIMFEQRVVDMSTYAVFRVSNTSSILNANLL